MPCRLRAEEVVTIRVLAERERAGQCLLCMSSEEDWRGFWFFMRGAALAVLAELALRSSETSRRPGPSSFASSAGDASAPRADPAAPIRVAGPPHP